MIDIDEIEGSYVPESHTDKVEDEEQKIDKENIIYSSFFGDISTELEEMIKTMRKVRSMKGDIMDAIKPNWLMLIFYLFILTQSHPYHFGYQALSMSVLILWQIWQ